jgi:hypothetical protein
VSTPAPERFAALWARLGPILPGLGIAIVLALVLVFVPR